jgi:citronellol/citronellal dehydrogenase
MSVDGGRSEVLADGLLSGQVVIVTGGGTGLGRAIALELARCGASVVLAGRREAPLIKTAEECGERCWTRPTDIRVDADVEALIGAVLDRHGRIDVLVNNAGGQFLAPAEQTTTKGFSAVVGLNLVGTWRVTHAAATGAFIPQRAGRIINITISPHNGMPGMAHAGAARAGVENLTRTLATEWARFGITAVGVALGTFATEALEKYPESVRESAGRVAPIQRLGRPEELAWLVAFLASGASTFISGTVITADGGRDNWPGSWPPPEASDDNGEPLAETRP